MAHRDDYQTYWHLSWFDEALLHSLHTITVNHGYHLQLKKKKKQKEN